MKLRKSKTDRGFDLNNFEDAYGVSCSLQESSSVIHHVWLGVNDADPQIMASKTPQGGTGWVPYEIPNDVLLTTRMHLNTRGAWVLGWKLIRFAIRRRL